MPHSSTAERSTAPSASPVSHNGADLELLLQQARDGDETARDGLFQLVYDDLHKAAHRMMPSANGDTLQPTALVNELMVRFLKKPGLANLRNCSCFFSVAVNAMEKILIERFRRKSALKRGGNWQRLPLDAVLDQIQADNGSDYGAIHDALERLRQEHPRQHDVVRHRFFGGLTVRKTAEMLEVSVQTIERDWRFARAKLHHILKDDRS